MSVQLTLFDPLPNLLEPFRKMLNEHGIRINFWQFREKRFVVGNELEQQVGRLDALVKREDPVDSFLPEDAHRLQHDLVEPDEPVSVVVVVVVIVAVEKRVSVETR